MDIGLIGGDIYFPLVLVLRRNIRPGRTSPADAGPHAATPERKFNCQGVNFRAQSLRQRLCQRGFET
jgi:hypothetical protein